jgi:Family of unknown function (DUF5947)
VTRGAGTRPAGGLRRFVAGAAGQQPDAALAPDPDIAPDPAPGATPQARAPEAGPPETGLLENGPGESVALQTGPLGTGPLGTGPLGTGPDATPGSAAGAAEEKCEMCAAAIPAEHGHVADLEAATLICACRACYLLFTDSGAGRGRYKAVPDRYLYDAERQLPAPRWDQLDIPVGLAFFLHSSERGEVTGFYPGPAGATECRLDLRAWDALAADYPLLAAAAPDVEATLISRTDAGVECFLVPIDACYELAGRMRLYWRGFDGGAEARESIEAFLRDVRQRARPLRREA